MSKLAEINKIITRKQEIRKFTISEEDKNYDRYKKLNEYQKQNALCVAVATTDASFIQVFQPIVDSLGFQDGYFACVLINRYMYHVKNNELLDESWFYLTHDTLNTITKMGEKAQNSRIKSLKDKGLINVENKGIGNKRYFKLNISPLIEMLHNPDFVATLRNIENDQNKAKAAHLPAGPKAKKSVVNNVDNCDLNSLQVGETSSLLHGETTSSQQEGLLSPGRRNILYTINNPSSNHLNPEDIEYPSIPSTNISKGSVDKGEFEVKTAIDSQQQEYNKKVLAKVSLLEEQFPTMPGELIEFLQSRVSKAYEIKHHVYEAFDQYYFVFGNLYEIYKDRMNLDGFKSVFNDFFNSSSTNFFNVKSFIENRIHLRLGIKKSKFGKPMYRAQYVLKTFTAEEKAHYRRLYNTYDSMFPWQYFNEIMGTALSPAEIEETKQKWSSFKDQLGLA